MARSLGVEIQTIEVKKPNEFDGAFRTAINKRAEALMLAGGGFFGANQSRLIELAAKHRLPATYPNSQFVEAGGLMAYTEDRIYMFGRAVPRIGFLTRPAMQLVSSPLPRQFGWLCAILAT